MRKLNFNNIKNNKIIIIFLILLILLTFLTRFYGSTDTQDYSDTAKYFAGKHSAKIRSSHSYFFGFIHSPFVWLMNSFIIFKITSLIFLFCIIYSVYAISGKDKKSFWLMFLSPIVWYMAPWINPIQLASLLFLWSYYFIFKYNREDKIKYLFYSGILMGLALVFWDAVLFFGFFLALSFLFNKKFSHCFYFVLFLIIGLSPRLILDNFLFNFPFYTLLKNNFGTIVNSSIMGGSTIGQGQTKISFATIFSVFLVIPIYSWKFYKPSFFKRNKKTMIFFLLSLSLILFVNPQIRYTLILIPIMILFLTKTLNEKQFKKQIIFSFIIIILFVFPYLIQINYSENSKKVENSLYGVDFTYILNNLGDIKFDKYSEREKMQKGLEEIISKHPNEVFLVGNFPDGYAILANLYWGEKVKEFVSIQDYSLVFKNETFLYEKKFMPTPNIKTRRQIWISGGINKNEKDKTDYEGINFSIGINEPVNISEFTFIEQYENLYLSKKY